MVEEMKITVPYVNTVDNLADFFTKPLKPRLFYPFRDKIMNIPHGLPDSVDGGAGDRSSRKCGVGSRGGVKSGASRVTES